MSARPSLDDYVDVAERIQDFKDAHPDGSLQTLGWEVVTVEGQDVKAGKPAKTTFIVYRAAAFRTADDASPGHGIAWEPFPGRTPYTKDSELMNAETAAWGRAIIALGLVANRKLASRQEVRNRMEDQKVEQSGPIEEVHEDITTDAEGPLAKPIDVDVLAQLRATCNERQVTENDLAWMLLSVGCESLPENPDRASLGKAMKGLNLEQAFKLDALLKGEDEANPGSEQTA